MDEQKLRAYLHTYVWLPVMTEEVVVDYVRQARLGEGPRLLAFGEAGTGKTRLAEVLSALMPRLVVMDDLTFNSKHTKMLVESTVTYPIYGATRNRALAQIWRGCPVIYLPIVSYSALRDAGIPAAVSAGEMRRNAEAVWS